MPSPRRSDGRPSLAFITDRRVAVRDGSSYVDVGVGRVLDVLEEEFEVTLLASGPANAGWLDHRVSIPKDRVRLLPLMPTTLRATPKTPSARKMIRSVESAVDVSVVQLLFPAPLALLGAKVPRVYHLCSDPGEVGRRAAHYGGWRRPAAVAAAGALDATYRKLIAHDRTAVVANGEELLARFAGDRGSSLVSSTIRTEEIDSVARARALSAPFRVLFVGRLSAEKGIDTLLEAFRGVLDRKPDAELVLVGELDRNERGLGDLLERMRRPEALGDRLIVRGPVPFGPALFQEYADADVLALPSRSEGTPRVLVEARAFRCPVVATEVGGIPSSVAHGADGLLVPPDAPDVLAAAMLRIRDDRHLRNRLIEAGLERSRRHTVDALAGALADAARALLAPPAAKGSPKLSVLTQYYPPEMGAPQVRLSELGDRLGSLGWDIEVLTALPNYPRGKVFESYAPLWTAIERRGAARVVRVPLVASARGMAGRLATYGSFAASAVINGYRHGGRPDLLLVESPPLTTAASGLALARLWRCPYVFNVSDLWPESALEMGLLPPGRIADGAAALARRAYRSAAAVTGQSDEIIERVKELSPGVRTMVVTNGVEPARFGRSLADDDARALLDAGSGVVFLYAGLLGMAQGLDVVLDAASQLGSDPGIEIRLVGAGPVRERLIERVRLEQIANVRILPEQPRERIPALLGAADVALVTLGMRLTGAVPSKLYEAMASELAVLLMAEGEAVRRVSEARCGLAVQPGDAAGLAAAMRQLAGDPELRVRLGSKGREAAVNRYARSAVAERLDGFLREVLGDGDGHR